MGENRDFLKEFEELRVETDGIRNALVSKTGLSNNLLFDSGVLKEIVREWKAIRKENKAIKEENDKKFEELLQENREIRQKLEEIEKKNEDKQKKMLEKIKKIREKVDPEIPIRDTIIGEWKMVDHENFEGYKKHYPNRTLKIFSQRVKYESVDGKLQLIATIPYLVEVADKYEENGLFVEDNHVKTFWNNKETADRYIENGKLHVIDYYRGEVWKRVYEKI